MPSADPASRRRIVLLTYYYPPSPEVGGLRAQKVARAFHNAGWDVVVITVRLPGEGDENRADPDGMRIITIVPRKNPRQWYMAFKRRRHRKAGAGRAGDMPAPQSYAIPTRVPLWKRTIFSLLWLPDDQQGFIHPAVCAARPLLRAGDIVYTTAPPFSVHLAGWRLARSGIRWIAEFRDPWTDNPWKPWHVRTALSDAIERRLERRCLKRADLVVAVSQGIFGLFQAKATRDTARLLLVRNGIDHLLPPHRSGRPGPFSLVHVGTFYHGRDPRPFLSGVAELKRSKRLSPKILRVHLIGRCRWFNGMSVEQEVQRLGIGDLVRFHDWIPHNECERLVEAADGLLLLAMSQPDQVPNKLYEYLGVRRPILAMVDAGGESENLLGRVGGHYILTSPDPTGVAAAIESMLEHREEPLPDHPLLGEWTTASQMKKLLEGAEQLA